ncbi:hypothetical protein ACQ86I_18175 [Prescottella equi]
MRSRTVTDSEMLSMPWNPAIADTARIPAGAVRPSTRSVPDEGFIRPLSVNSSEVRPEPAKPWITASPPNGMRRSTGPNTGPSDPLRVSPSARTASACPEGSENPVCSSMLVTAAHQPRFGGGIDPSSQTQPSGLRRVWRESVRTRRGG